MHFMMFAALAAAPAQDEGQDQLTPAQVLEQLGDIRRLMKRSADHLNEMLPERSKEKQKDAIREIEEILKRARAALAFDSRRRERDRDRADRVQPPPRPGREAPKPYDPKHDPGAVFQSKTARDLGWNAALPAGMRDAVLEAMRHLDEYPAEFQPILREWSKAIANPKK